MRRSKKWTGFRFQPTPTPGVAGEPREVTDAVLISSGDGGWHWLLTCGHLSRLTDDETVAEKPKRIRCHACARIFYARDLRQREKALKEARRTAEAQTDVVPRLDPADAPP